MSAQPATNQADVLIAMLTFAAEINAETVREQQREIGRLQGLLAAAGIDYEEKA